jgi:(1->4)-alpha-D-glucan 1-alpha-D-glucosylmutase
MLNSLSQLALKLGSPGVPDFYQGSELWDLSLVDPDNRRPVDFAARRQRLDAVASLVARAAAGSDAADAVRSLLARWTDGTIKLFITACGLQFRRHHAALVLDGAYVPIAPDGPRADHLVAFGRRTDAAALIVVAPRLVAPLVAAGFPAASGADVWGTTALPLPEGQPAGPYRHVLTGVTIVTSGPAGAPVLAPHQVLGTSPVAVLAQIGPS